MRSAPGGRAVLEGPEPYLDERTTALAPLRPFLATDAVARPLFGNVAVILAIPRASVRACVRRNLTVAPFTGSPALSSTRNTNRTRAPGLGFDGATASCSAVPLAL